MFLAIHNEHNALLALSTSEKSTFETLMISDFHQMDKKAAKMLHD